MKTELIIALLIMACIGSLAAMFIFWSKLDEQKKLTQEERDRRWDEISLRLNVEKELEQSKAREKCTAQSVQWYANQLIECERKRREANNKNRDMQDKMSAFLCPTANHVWKDGVCVKCGRMK